MLTSTTTELTWLTYLLHVGLPFSLPPVIYYDNVSAMRMTVNPIFHARTKHIKLDYHFFREKVAKSSLITKYVPSSHQVADIFIKALSHPAFDRFKTKLGLCSIPWLSL